MKKYLLLPLLVAATFTPSLRADENDREAIIRNIASYVDAFNAKDAKAVAEHWSENGVWMNRDTGERVTGRKAIEAQFHAVFAASTIEGIDISVNSIRFVTKNVAIEEGVANVRDPDGTNETAYTVVHVKENGSWKVDSVRENAVRKPAETAAANPLDALAWMVGRWEDKSPDSTIETTCRWTRNRAFLTRSFKVVIDGKVDLEGHEVIGWDPNRKSIRSWMFDSAGGFGEGRWIKSGNSWRVSFMQTLPEGGYATATHLYTVVDEQSFQWQSTGRRINGQLAPDIPQATVTKVGE